MGWPGTQYFLGIHGAWLNQGRDLPRWPAISGARIGGSHRAVEAEPRPPPPSPVWLVSSSNPWRRGTSEGLGGAEGRDSSGHPIMDGAFPRKRIQGSSPLPRLLAPSQGTLDMRHPRRTGKPSGKGLGTLYLPWRESHKPPQTRFSHQRDRAQTYLESTHISACLGISRILFMCMLGGVGGGGNMMAPT